MPLYECQCNNAHRFERHIPLSEYNEPIICLCGANARRVIVPPRILRPINYEYDCPITGKHITSKHAHDENLKVHGCRVRETTEREYNSRIRREAETAMEKKIDQTIEREIDQMPSEKREQLAKELSLGLDCGVERK